MSKYRPTVAIKGSQTIVSYNVENFAALKLAVEQLYLVLRKLVGRSDFFKVKNGTQIRIETPENESLRLHFLIPVSFNSPDVIYTVIEEYSGNEDSRPLKALH